MTDDKQVDEINRIVRKLHSLRREIKSANYDMERLVKSMGYEGKEEAQKILALNNIFGSADSVRKRLSVNFVSSWSIYKALKGCYDLKAKAKNNLLNRLPD